MRSEAIEQDVRSDPALKLDSGSARAAGALISFDGVWRHWGRGSKRWAVLRGVDLQVDAGTAVCIAGGNGAGKTTLLRIATAILSPDQGSVTIDGIRSDGNWREYHRRIGFLSAGDRGLYNRFSVRGHLAFTAALALLPRPERRPAVEEALVRFGLAELSSRRSERLSQGQRQRLRLALAFVHRPRVVLLDEPRNSLDAEGLSILSNAVAEVLAQGGAVIWCAPTGEEQPIQFDRSYLIADGTLTASA
ncbi:MAG: ATP-binding cassette domain-containing protein [Solirubrobacteraceae bacterium]